MRAFALACGLVAALALGGCRAGGPDGPAADAGSAQDPLGGVEATLDQLEPDVTGGG